MNYERAFLHKNIIDNLFLQFIMFLESRISKPEEVLTKKLKEKMILQ
jgi:hypothetical protein